MKLCSLMSMLSVNSMLTCVMCENVQSRIYALIDSMQLIFQVVVRLCFILSLSNVLIVSLCLRVYCEVLNFVQNCFVIFSLTWNVVH